MGIKHFFSWFRKKFPDHIIQANGDNLNIKPDIVMVDLNAIFHTSAQRIFKYGQYKQKSFLTTKLADNKFVYADICVEIDKIISYIPPQKTLVLCVDGCAPLSKQQQQRQRRFLSAKNNNSAFDSNSITPGTEFIHNMTNYIQNYIYSKEFPFDIYFSNEKVAGEGEHKLIDYIRKYGQEDWSYCIYGGDADLIMLALATHKQKFYIVRENNYGLEYNLVCLEPLRLSLLDHMRWSENFNQIQGIEDFITMCFLVGNDFLPTAPGIEIIQGSIDYMFEAYKENGKVYGHLTEQGNFRPVAMKYFLKKLAQQEQIIVANKLCSDYFPDPLLQSCVKDELDFDLYKQLYYEQKFNTTKRDICSNYLRGMEWVLKYYVYGVPDWCWKYPYYYAPFCSDLYRYVLTHQPTKFDLNNPSLPFIQLLSVLPKSSSALLPTCLQSVLTEQEFTIDLAGKKNDWECVVLLPMIDQNIVRNIYNQHDNLFTEQERKRNDVQSAIIKLKKI